MSNANYEQYEQHYGEEDDPLPKSGGFNWLLGCGLGCGVMILICCGGIGILGYQMAQLFEQSFTDVPEEIVVISDSIATFDRPESFEPEVAAEFDFNVFGRRIIANGAVYKTVVTVSIKKKVEFGEAFAGNSVEYLQQQMSSFIEQGQNPESTLVFDDEPIELPVTIRGEESTFQFTRGKDIKDDQEYIQVLGGFPGAEGPAVVWGILPLETYSEQDIIDMIKSIE